MNNYTKLTLLLFPKESSLALFKGRSLDWGLSFLISGASKVGSAPAPRESSHDSLYPELVVVDYDYQVE